MTQNTFAKKARDFFQKATQHLCQLGDALLADNQNDAAISSYQNAATELRRFCGYA